jgi:hypothetical protein
MAAVRDKPEAKEGDPPQGTYFIVAFDSLADAKKWYSTPPYKDLIPERQKAAGQTSSSSSGCRNNAAAPDNRCWRARSPSVGAVGNGRVAPIAVVPGRFAATRMQTFAQVRWVMAQTSAAGSVLRMASAMPSRPGVYRLAGPAGHSRRSRRRRTYKAHDRACPRPRKSSLICSCML